MPVDSRMSRAAMNDFIGEKRIDVANGVDLARRRVAPAGAEKLKTPGDLLQHETRLFSHGFGTVFAVADDALPIARLDRPRLRAPGNHEARRSVGRCRHRERERMKGGLGRGSDFRTDIAACDRVHFAVVHAPLTERDHVGLVEFAEPLLGELAGRAQLAGAERGKGPASRLYDGFDSDKAFHQWHWRSEAIAFDLESAARRNTS